MQKILLLTGMTPDPRIFERLLPLLPSAVVVDWISPNSNESIASYADRLSRTIVNDQPTIVCGVSFGGIVARELASCLDARACVLVSSVRSPSELPPWYRCFRAMPPRFAESTMKIVGEVAARWPRKFRFASTWRLRKLNGTSGDWYRWATAAVLNWTPSQGTERVPVIHIHGDRDSTFPIRYTQADRIVRGGGHILPLTNCTEVAEILLGLAAEHSAA